MRSLARNLKKRLLSLAPILLRPASRYILLLLCRLASRSGNKARKESYLNRAYRYRLWAFRPGSRELITTDLDRALGLKLRVNLCELVGTQLCAGLPFEPVETSIARKLIEPGDVVFDVGANIGIYSLLAARVAGGIQVHAFEPAPFAYELLSANLSLNHVRNVRLVQAAVGEQSGETDLYINTESALTSLGLTKRGAVVATRKSPCIALDDYAAENAISQINFMKIDVEGFEGQVLRGAKDLIERSANLVILCELAEKNYAPLGFSVNDVMDWMRERGYDIWEIEKTGAGIVRLDHNRSEYANQNFLFVRAGSGKQKCFAELSAAWSALPA